MQANKQILWSHEQIKKTKKWEFEETRGSWRLPTSSFERKEMKLIEDGKLEEADKLSKKRDGGKGKADGSVCSAEEEKEKVEFNLFLNELNIVFLL